MKENLLTRKISSMLNYVGKLRCKRKQYLRQSISNTFPKLESYFVKFNSFQEYCAAFELWLVLMPLLSVSGCHNGFWLERMLGIYYSIWSPGWKFILLPPPIWSTSTHFCLTLKAVVSHLKYKSAFSGWIYFLFVCFLRSVKCGWIKKVAYLVEEREGFSLKRLMFAFISWLKLIAVSNVLNQFYKRNIFIFIKLNHSHQQHLIKNLTET